MLFRSGYDVRDTTTNKNALPHAYFGEDNAITEYLHFSNKPFYTRQKLLVPAHLAMQQKIIRILHLIIKSQPNIVGL